MKKTGAFFGGILAFVLVFSLSAEAGQFRLGHKYNNAKAVNEEILQLAQDEDGYGDADVAISPSQAASIAKQSWPGSKVLRVQLLPSGVYAVTLKQGGEVSRVKVDASTGAIV
jgi:uncharacterized membrane protein YkoI